MPPPPDDMSAWLNTKLQICDLYVVGTQECNYKYRSGYSSVDDDFTQTVLKNLSSDFSIVANTHMWEIRIAVFAHKRIAGRINNVESHTEATGIAHAVGNKGGTAVSFAVDDLSVCFVSSHLAAHQTKCAKRNSDYAEIVQGIRLGKQKMDILNQFHHVFWLGDLNYRLDFGDQKEDEPAKELWNEMTAMVFNGRYSDLFQYDQLTREIKEKRAFVGFVEGTYDFIPTFKVHPAKKIEKHIKELEAEGKQFKGDKQLVYHPKRSPAYCDRVLWKSLPGYTLKQTHFNATKAIMTSDHKPVWSVFSLKHFVLPGGNDISLGAASLTITNLKAKGLSAADVNSSDPYVIFCGAILSDDVRVPYKSSTLNPEWKDAEVPSLKLKYNSKARLRVSHLQFRIKDHDTLSKNDAIAFGIIGLDKVVDSTTPVAIEMPLSFAGTAAGTLTFSAQLVYATAAAAKKT